MNEKPPTLPRLNDDPEPGELDDEVTSTQVPDPKILAQARGEADVPTAPPPPSNRDSDTLHTNRKLKAL
jgi:hypothetical protein